MSYHQLKMTVYHKDYEIIVNHFINISEELNLLKQTMIKKTKNDQSYFFYIHIKIVVFVGIIFLLVSKRNI